ncbi:protein of unknown function [Nitratireductor aquimarinus]
MSRKGFAGAKRSKFQESFPNVTFITKAEGFLFILSHVVSVRSHPSVPMLRSCRPLALFARIG